MSIKQAGGALRQPARHTIRHRKTAKIQMKPSIGTPSAREAIRHLLPVILEQHNESKHETEKSSPVSRSSKDRSDVSIAAQRRRLMDLASDQGYLIVNEYKDVVESAKSEHRPGFQTLLRDIDSPTRDWTTLLILDHSRLSRQQYIGPIFRFEASRKGIEVVFASSPDLDPISTVILDAVLDSMSVVHSLMSKEKGLGGMAENIHQGYRAGGRAPRGYALRPIETGAIRDGSPVTKSVLVPSEDAPLVSRYLKARASGDPRTKVIRELGIPWNASSLVDLEWNALTYAGHTVWNVRNEKDPAGGYKGKTKRKPRNEWVIKENTHPALITTDEANRLIGALESGLHGKAVSEAKAGNSSYLLTGLLRAPDGREWIGDGKRHYRLKAVGEVAGRWLRMADVDAAVTARLIQDIHSPTFVRALTAEARRANAIQEDPSKELRQQIHGINAQINKAGDLALQLDDPAPMLKKINELEARRKLLQDEIERTEQDYQAQRMLSQVTEGMVRKVLKTIANNFEVLPRERWKGLIRGLVEKIELDPGSLGCQILYRIAVEDRPTMASPRGVEPLSSP
jgi:site-specific DNA recombinase